MWLQGFAFKIIAILACVEFVLWSCDACRFDSIKSTLVHVRASRRNNESSQSYSLPVCWKYAWNIFHGSPVKYPIIPLQNALQLIVFTLHYDLYRDESLYAPHIHFTTFPFPCIYVISACIFTELIGVMSHVMEWVIYHELWWWIMCSTYMFITYGPWCDSMAKIYITVNSESINPLCILKENHYFV